MTAVFLAALAGIVSAPAAGLEVEVVGLRNQNGVLRACLMEDRRRFPDCGSDPAAIKQNAAARNGHISFAGFKPGTYAITIFHDENGNGRFDTVLGIPREGFGFSRNPVVRFGAPRYDKVSIELGPGLTRLKVRLQYLL